MITKADSVIVVPNPLSWRYLKMKECLHATLRHELHVLQL